MEAKFKIVGLDCANCASELEEEIEKVEGVTSVNVSFVNQVVDLIVDSKETLKKVKDVCNHFEEVKVVENTHKIKITGLDCASCALELEEEIEKIEGVSSASVDFVGQVVIVDCDNPILNKVKEVCNHFEEVKVVEEQKRFKIKGLDCASCAAELEEELLKINGVSAASVDFVNQTVTVECDDSLLKKVKFTCNNFEEVKVVEEEEKEEFGVNKLNLILIIISSILFIGTLIGFIVLKNIHPEQADDPASLTNIISYVGFGLSYLIVGWPVLWKTVKSIGKGNVFDENFLMTVASLGAIALTIATGENEVAEAAAVMLLYQIGELLQSIAVNSSRKEIVGLMDLQSEFATKVVGDELVVVEPSELNIGDIILIKNGEKVPTDAVIVEGETSFDTKSLTGESLPKECKVDDEIMSGFINCGSVIKAKVVRAYEDSTVCKILDLVENSSSKKAEPEKFITKFAKYYTPIVCSIAFAIAVLVPLIISLFNQQWGANYLTWVPKALNLLVISCPCALIISVPLTYFGGVGACAKRGVLVKGATYLDLLSKTTVAAYDKTGTLTEGVFKISNIVSEDKDNMMKIASAMEKGSNHPIARSFDEIETDVKFDTINEIPGHGMEGIIGEDKYYAGNAKLMRLKEITFEEVNSVSTIIYIAKNNELMGYVEIDDVIKEDALVALQKMKKEGVMKQVMLTGDNKAKAEYVGTKLCLDEVNGELLPAQKLEKAEALKKEGTLLYVGDGINDAPVMVCADVAVSMGQLGSDAAIEASDVVLVGDKLSEIPNAIHLAKKTKKIVFENIIGSIAVKVILMVLSIALPAQYAIPLFVAVFADVGVMLLAVLNSLRMKIKLKD